MAERLDGEWRRAVQQAAADVTAPAYVTWLKDEGALLSLLEGTLFPIFSCWPNVASFVGARRHYAQRNAMKHASRVAARMIDHIYFRRFDPVKKNTQQQEKL